MDSTLNGVDEPTTNREYRAAVERIIAELDSIGIAIRHRREASEGAKQEMDRLAKETQVIADQTQRRLDTLTALVLQ